jgi:hypothetical protein
MMNDMEHRVTFKTPDGVLQEKLFDNFNEFADTIDDIANQFYSGMKPEVSVETIYDNLVRREKVTNGESASEPGGMEFLSENDQPSQG